MELNAETRSVNEIFSPSKKYVVPRFQREYSWTQEEIDEFWEDIVQQITAQGSKPAKHEEYFIGCIVLVGEDTRPDYLIVDGQQRLTTLTLLLRCIVARLDALGDSAAAQALYNNVIEGTDNDGKKYFKLANESPKPFFQNELQAMTPEKISTASTDEEKNLKDAFDKFTKRVSSYKLGTLSDLESTKSLREQVLNHLKFILVTAKNEDDAYTIFETLNARGLSLTSVDLIKNWIFKNYKTTHPNDNAKDIWGSLRREISKFADLETFFRHYWNSKYAFASNDRLYKSFKDLLKKNKIAPAKEFLLELQAAAKFYKMICAPDDRNWPQQKEKPVGRALKLINSYKVTQVRPYLLSLLAAREAKTVAQTDFVNSVTNVESFHFAFSNLCQERASGLEGTYTRAAKKLYAAGTNKTKAKQAIVALNESIKKKLPAASKISDAVRKLSLDKNNDNDKKTIQIVFTKLEHYLQGTNELKIESISIEHVKDQSSGDDWASGIGNLIPLDEKLNNEMKKGLSFRSKKEIYKKSNLKIVALFLQQNPQDTWTKKDSERWSKVVCDNLATALAIK
ncbi:TPA: DUF262 domain-containing protein [Stenotrophomonas maltophilia]